MSIYLNWGYLAFSKGLPWSGKIRDMDKANELSIQIISVTSYKKDEKNLKHCTWTLGSLKWQKLTLGRARSFIPKGL